MDSALHWTGTHSSVVGSAGLVAALVGGSSLPLWRGVVWFGCAGILLCGEPGCGKTLLAKAVAGEAGVNFFSVSASQFVEIFVGVGASRVRALYNEARENAPAVVFIDELDAVGRQRGLTEGSGGQERDATLNQVHLSSPSKGLLAGWARRDAGR